jgi:hypothetical protein
MPGEVVEKVCPEAHATLLKQNEGKLVAIGPTWIKILSVDLAQRRVKIEHVPKGSAGVRAGKDCEDAIAFTFWGNIANFFP